MPEEQTILRRVRLAREDTAAADSFIEESVPFIRKTAARVLGGPCRKEDDAYSIALLGFYEAIRGYEPRRGPFFAYAELVIRSRVLDYCRKEARQPDLLSLDAEPGAPDAAGPLPAREDPLEEAAALEALRQEIRELRQVMEPMGLDFSRAADQMPRQERSLRACLQAVRWAGEDRALLNEVLKTGRVPMARLAEGAGVARKTLERHRGYVLLMLLVQTNGYERIRAHLQGILRRKGGAKA